VFFFFFLGIIGILNTEFYRLVQFCVHTYIHSGSIARL